MPNTEVKLINAESTWPEAAREDRKLLIKETPTQIGVGVFCCVLWAVSWEPVFCFCKKELRFEN